MVSNERRSFLRPRLSLKITTPYLVLSLILGLATVYLAARMQAAALNDAFSVQLSDSGRRVSDSVVRQEQNHLAALRTLANLQGMPTALRSGDRRLLSELIIPYAANEQIARVIVLDQRGSVVWAAQHSGGGPIDYALYQPEEELSGWPFVAAVLSGSSDERGDKFAGLQQEAADWIFYTAGPIYDQEEQIGALLVGTPLLQLVSDWRETNLVDVTIYNPDGQPLATSLGRSDTDQPPTLSTEDYRAAINNQEQPLDRPLTLGSRDYREVIGPLLVRDQTLGAIGVALPLQGVEVRRDHDAMMIVFLYASGSLAVVLVGIWLARRFTRPITELARASEAVATGDLSQQLAVRSRDELGDLTTSFNLMVSGLRERERMRDVLGRFVSPTVAELVLKHPLDLSGELRLLTILFTDIRDFTSMSEQQEPAEVVQTLNEYFAVVVEAAERHHGLVNKFGGDSTLVIFGLTESEESGAASALAATKAALDIRRGIRRLNETRAAAGREPIRMGIGINTGQAIAGLIGSEQRMEYTVIGDAVNLSARIQALTREIGGDILISAATYESLQQQDRPQVADLGTWHVKGKQREVRLYSLLEQEASDE